MSSHESRRKVSSLEMGRFLCYGFESSDGLVHGVALSATGGLAFARGSDLMVGRLGPVLHDEVSLLS